MSFVNKSEASRLTGKSRNTIGAHLKSGKLSGEQNEDGDWESDASQESNSVGKDGMIQVDETPYDLHRSPKHINEQSPWKTVNPEYVGEQNSR